MVNLGNITTIRRANLAAQLGVLGLDREAEVLQAIQAAFGLLPQR